MNTPKIIYDLVERFERNIDSYKKGNYNETQVRNEFINPFFEALGWDVRNKKGYAEAYKDVIHEYSQKTKDVAETPDYCFRIGGTRKFFVEAKKPGINLKEDIHPAYQLRRYAWSAKLPLSILTDFEEFAVYDCTIVPRKNDKASTGRIIYYTYKDYVDKWDELLEIFARESILKGSFDKFAESKRKKRGTTEVDETFLKEIEIWREILARNIALRNPDLTTRELNYSVQKTIDRIIFLRICEDRGIEDYGQLMNLQNGSNIYKRLNQIYTRADEKYNSGLFHFEKEKEREEEPDELTPNLSIDDKTLKDIIKNLYYPDSPYEFSVFPAEILGQVYEQFLGKVIRLTPAHRAIVEDKPEVKKAGGVYYTPTYIVNYIVENTLGKKLQEIYDNRGKTVSNIIKKISEIKVLDPACGSGSFLLGAYQYLLDFHLKLYIEDDYKDEALKKNYIYQLNENDYRLTTAERKRILLNNIHGVDIDTQAVEVTKLSLLLKVLEGESNETLSNQMNFFRERALPDLSSNIKCGNSLIGPDFYDQMEFNFLDEEEKLRINVFDWESEFESIMNDGGFDVVIGNPPYVRIHEISEVERKYFKNHFISALNQFDLYQLFYEKGLKLLNAECLLGYISSNKFCITQYGLELRKLIIDDYSVNSIVDASKASVFKNVSTYPFIFIIKNTKPDKQNVNIYEIQNYGEIQFNYSDKQSALLKGVNQTISISSTNKAYEIITKIENRGDNNLLNVYRGRGTTKDLVELKKDDFIKSLTNKEINRYVLSDKIFYKSSKKYMVDNSKKLLMKKICFNLEVAIDLEGEINPINTVYVIKPKIDNIELFYLLALLNSKLLSFYARTKYKTTAMRGGYIELRVFEVTTLPIVISESEFIDIVEEITVKSKSLYNQKNNYKLSKTPQEKTALKRQIEATDKQIDKLVYELYGLTEEEIKIVEFPNA